MAANTQQDLLHRTLKQLPVKILRDTWDIKGQSQDDLINGLIASNKEDALFSFFFDNFNYTKQHIYIYQLDHAFNLPKFNQKNFPYVLEQAKIIPGGIEFFCLPLVTYTGTLISPYEKKQIQFYQPLKITLENDLIIFQFTILEKNLSAYLPASRLVKTHRDLDEDYFRQEINNYISSQYIIEICDLNKGVKHLLRNNVIGLRFVKYKKSKSTTTETMDEDNTFREAYPGDFDKMMKEPLMKALMQYLTKDDKFPHLFTVDSSLGQLGFSTYPQNVNQINNVTTTILSKN